MHAGLPRSYLQVNLLTDFMPDLSSVTREESKEALYECNRRTKVGQPLDPLSELSKKQLQSSYV
jgi:hypothetical protein